jgi:putative membrane protein
MATVNNTNRPSDALSPALPFRYARRAAMPLIVRHILESLAFVGIGIVAFTVAFFVITKITPFSIRKEIEEDQNTALGIVIGSVFIGLAIIIAAAIHGGSPQ